MASKPIHSLSPSQVYPELQTSPDGLSTAEVADRLALYGENVLSEVKPEPIWLRAVSHATHPMGLMMGFVAILAFLIGHWSLGLIICLVVLINAGFSFWREYRASQALQTLRRLLPDFARVIRDKKEFLVPAPELVPGDILVLAEGDHIPADARVVEEFGLRTNNASLTGESMPVRKIADASLREDLSEVERPNLIFAGTSIAAGTCRAVVYSTGMLTQFGRISHLTLTVKEGPSALQQEMIHLTRWLSLATLVLGGVVCWVGFSEMHMPLREAFILAIGIVAAMLPEGLVPTVTLTLAAAVQRLAQQGVLVKKLSTLETLGTASVICTDKSGTLTQNQMTVRRVWVGGKTYSVSGVGYEPNGKITAGASCSDLHEFLTAGLLCNNARLNPPGPGKPIWSCLGDQTEVALITLALKGGLDEARTKSDLPRIHELPFDARRKRMTTIHHAASGELAYTKGAPKEILQQCDSIWINGAAVPLDNRQRAEILSANDDFARQALRVLALACRKLPARSGVYSNENIEQHLTFLGLAAMMDPPRLEVSEAIAHFHSAGIRMVMITGDYGLTAESMARRIGMLQETTPRIITGSELDTLDDETLQRTLAQEVIYARMAPDHKLRLVSAFQSRGDIVAVIGDGVNDVPALRKADIGIAMGVTGADVAKEAANVILMNDNLLSVVHAIEEGRGVYDNLRKFITYIFASNVPEILPFILTSFLGIPLALRVSQILAIDLGTDLLPALALGMEKPEPDVMTRPPRNRSQNLLDSSLVARGFLWLGGIEGLLCFVLFFWIDQGNFSWVTQLPLPPGVVTAWFGSITNLSAAHRLILATTAFQAGVVMAQVGNAFACRSEKGNVRWLGLFSNRYLLGGILVEILLIIGMIYWTPLAGLLENGSLPPGYWLILIWFAPLLYGLERTRKMIFKIFRHKSTRHQPVNGPVPGDSSSGGNV
jgi:P-type Ca2+ transporter type 2C